MLQRSLVNISSTAICVPHRWARGETSAARKQQVTGGWNRLFAGKIAASAFHSADPFSVAFFLCIKRMERGWKCDGLDPSYSELVIPVSFEAFVYSMDLARFCLDVYPFLRAFRPFKRIIVVFFSFVFYLGELDNGLKREGMKTRQYLENCNGELEWQGVRLNYGEKAFALEKNI